jgi:hypothetical protein
MPPAAPKQPEPDYLELWALLLGELVEWQGAHYCTIRGLARLLGVSVSTFTDNRPLKSGFPRGVLRRVAVCSEDDLPESLKPIAGFDYQLYITEDTEVCLLSRNVVVCILKFYGYDSLKPSARARQLVKMLRYVKDADSSALSRPVEL